MAGFLLHQGAVVMCPHGGQGTPPAPNPRVLVSGLPTATIAAPWVVGGCVGIPPAVPPCVIGQWAMGTVRVTSMGLPLVAQAGVGITAPGPGALIPTTQQMRVQAM